MYLVALAWLYVVVLMALAEGVSDGGTWLGAAITFVLYGLVPMGIALYLLGTPARRSARRRAGSAGWSVAADSPGTGSVGRESIGRDPVGSDPVSLDPVGSDSVGRDPDGRGHAPGDAVAPIRKEP